MDDNTIRIAVLRKMLVHRWIGGRHTSIDNIPKGFPLHLREDVARIVQELIVDGFIVKNPTSYGEHIYMNPKRVHEVKKITGIFI